MSPSPGRIQGDRGCALRHPGRGMRVAGSPIPRSLAGLAERFATPAIDPPTLEQTIAARRRFFGETAVDPATGAVRSDQVLIAWFGCASFAIAMGGTVFLC